MKGYITYNSIINEDFLVILVYEDCPCYYPIRQLLNLDPAGHENVGGLLLGTKVIFIDGEKLCELNLTVDHLLAIEAHEISHDILGHNGLSDISKLHEIDADANGIQLLTEKGYHNAAKILNDRMSEYIKNINQSLTFLKLKIFDL